MMIVDTVENLIVGDRFYFADESYFDEFIKENDMELPLDIFNFYLIGVLPNPNNTDLPLLKVVGIDATLECTSTVVMVLPVSIDEPVWIDGSDDATLLLREYLAEGGHSEDEIADVMGIMFDEASPEIEEPENED